MCKCRRRRKCERGLSLVSLFLNTSLPKQKLQLAVYIQLVIFANACHGPGILFLLTDCGNFKMHLRHKWFLVDIKLVPHDPV